MASDTAPNFDARATARHLLRTAFQEALGTLDPDSGAPHVSLVTVATLPDLGSGTLEVSQAYSGFQLSGNGLYDADTINNVTQAATNVANSISH